MILFRHFKTKGRITLAALIRIQILPSGFVLNRYKPEGPSAGQDLHYSVNFQMISGFNKADMPVMIKYCHR